MREKCRSSRRCRAAPYVFFKKQVIVISVERAAILPPKIWTVTIDKVNFSPKGVQNAPKIKLQRQVQSQISISSAGLFPHLLANLCVKLSFIFLVQYCRRQQSSRNDLQHSESLAAKELVTLTPKFATMYLPCNFYEHCA